MTRKDFELIAAAIAEVESRYEGIEYAQMALGSVVEKIADAIEECHPRFDRGKFEAYALPIEAHRLKTAILAKLR